MHEVGKIEGVIMYMQGLLLLITPLDAPLSRKQYYYILTKTSMAKMKVAHNVFENTCISANGILGYLSHLGSPSNPHLHAIITCTRVRMTIFWTIADDQVRNEFASFRWIPLDSIPQSQEFSKLDALFFAYRDTCDHHHHTARNFYTSGGVVPCIMEAVTP